MTGITWEDGIDLFSLAFEPTDILMSCHETESANAWENSMRVVQSMTGLEDDWDGLGAKAPSQQIVQGALLYLQRLQGYSPVAPDRTLAGPTGSVIIEWQSGGSILEIEFEEFGVAEYCRKEAFESPVYWQDKFIEDSHWNMSWEQRSTEELSAVS